MTAFWPYAYEDVYYGIYGGYAYDSIPARSSRARTGTIAKGSGAAHLQVAAGRHQQLTDVADRTYVQRRSKPDEAQRAALDEFTAATAEVGRHYCRGACPTICPASPTGRLNAMRKARLQSCCRRCRPCARPSTTLQSCSATSRRHASIQSRPPTRRRSATRRPSAESHPGSPRGRVAGFADLPNDPYREGGSATRPRRRQPSLDELKAASVKAAKGLKGDCPAYQSLTPTGRGDGDGETARGHAGSGRRPCSLRSRSSTRGFSPTGRRPASIRSARRGRGYTAIELVFKCICRSY